MAPGQLPSYDTASRLWQVANGTNSATYTYLANSPLVGQIAFTNGGVQRMVTSKSYDNLNRLTQIASAPSASSAVTFSYAYNSANQRTAVTNADNSRWAYGYDTLGQVTSGKKYWNDATPVAGQQFEYSFDDIGNRQTAASGGDEYGANLRTAYYTNNGLNQITSRTVPGYVNVMGEATNMATVTLWSSSGAYATTSRKGDYFRGELAETNTAAALWLTITNLAVLTDGTNQAVVTNVVGNVFLAETPEGFGYDADGNLTNDGRWVFTWDGENRLVKVEGLASSPTASKRKVEWTYDYRGRRVQQTTYDGSSGSYVAMEDLKFVSDGWRHIAELNATNSALVRSYVWGLDLSGTETGAGGVGGLLLVTCHTSPVTSHFYAYDGNGNVVALVNASNGAMAAQYEYGPFGEVLRASGALAFENPFTFSTKFCDWETGFLYYGYRYYDPSTGRWPSRDPINEVGGLNLYAFVGNNAIQRFDRLGLCTAWWLTGPNIKISSAGNLSVTLTWPGPILGGILPGTVATDPERLELDPPSLTWTPGGGFTGDPGDLWSWSNLQLELKLILRFSIHGHINGSACCVCKNGTGVRNLNTPLRIDVTKTKYVTPPVVCFVMPTPVLKKACIAAKIVQWFGPDFDLIRNAYNAYKAYGWLQNENQRLLDAVCNKRVSNPWVVDIDIGRRPWDD